MIRVALRISVALCLTAGTALAADDSRQSLAVPQGQSTNGVIMQVVSPSTTLNTGLPTAITSQLWVYDTNTKQMMLCSSRADGSFTCTAAAWLNWQGR